MTRVIGYKLFETAVGVCGLAWDERRVIGAQLPEATVEKTRTRLARRHPDALETIPSAHARGAIDRIVSLLKGEPDDLADIDLNMDGLSTFQRCVYALTRTIAPGETRTYGEIARTLGEAPEAARAVRRALGQNPFPIIVPCHRVLGAGGKAGGFSANGGLAIKARMLTIEGARVGDEPTLFQRLPIAIQPRRRRSGACPPSA